ncbi:MAG: chemotaxis protein CheW [Burkholderiaceae bacterium]
MNELIDRSKTHLRELQARLNDRLRETSDGAGQDARLGLMIGSERYLVELSEAGEIVSASTPITAVPLTHDWFRGLVNLRGMLFAVSDLARFGGGEATPLSKESRLLALASRLNFNAAILVTRMMGLQNVSAMIDETPGAIVDAARPWIARGLRDDEGRSWYELSLQRLIGDERFVMVER